MAVGKEISFVSTHSLPPNEDILRDLGSAEIGGLDLASEILKSGWGKTKESKRDPTDEDVRKRDLESEAKSAGLGIWNPHGPQVSSLHAKFAMLKEKRTSGPYSQLYNARGLSGLLVRVQRKIPRW